MKKALLLSTMMALALGLNTASAQPADRGDMRPMMPTFAELDANEDGQVTIEELQAHRDARFAEADTDSDGAISLEELTAWTEAQQAERMQARTERMLSRLDTDDDGLLSVEELTARMGDGSRMIDRLDRDDDGAVSEEEFAQLSERVRGKMKDRMKGGRDGAGRHERGEDHGGRWFKRHGN